MLPWALGHTTWLKPFGDFSLPLGRFPIPHMAPMPFVSGPPALSSVPFLLLHDLPCRAFCTLLLTLPGALRLSPMRCIPPSPSPLGGLHAELCSNCLPSAFPWRDAPGGHSPILCCLLFPAIAPRPWHAVAAQKIVADRRKKKQVPGVSGNPRGLSQSPHTGAMGADEGPGEGVGQGRGETNLRGIELAIPWMWRL